MGLLSNPEQKPVDHPLVVVHVDSVWEGAERVADGVNLLSQEFGIVYLLVDNEDWRETTLVDFEPTEVVVAPGGQWSGVKADVAVFVGGYLRGCLTEAARAMVKKNPDVLIILNMEYVYHGPSRTLYQQYESNWKNDDDGFIRYITTCAKAFGFKNPTVILHNESLRIQEK